MAFLSASPLSRNSEKNKQTKNTRLFLNTILLKGYRLLFLVSIILPILSSICVHIEYVCVYNTYYIRLDGHNKEPQASKCNPITTGLAYISLWLFPWPPPPQFHWEWDFLEKFMKLHHVSFIPCSWAFLAEGQELWNFSLVPLLWYGTGQAMKKMKCGKMELRQWLKCEEGSVQLDQVRNEEACCLLSELRFL